ncbi:MAG: hypothetical protein D3903_09240 [Candidatus Electrothrix sp. GM3_4]|nr:hypothetical protein [Candidatus Electrothrix sp. GM3_4]
MVRQTDRFKKEILKEQRGLFKGLEVDLDALVEGEKILVSEIDSVRKGAEILKEKEFKWSRLVDEINRSRKGYKLFWEKLQEARISEQREQAKSANIFVSNAPSKPSKPISPNVKARLILALFAGLLAGFGAALAAFYMDHTVKGPRELEKFSGVPVLSSMGIIRRNT